MISEAAMQLERHLAGLRARMSGLFAEALEQLEYCYELSDGKEAWLVRDNEDVTLHRDACVHLHRIYTKLAISTLEDGDPETSVKYYLKAYNAAREGLL